MKREYILFMFFVVLTLACFVSAERVKVFGYTVRQQDTYPPLLSIVSPSGTVTSLNVSLNYVVRDAHKGYCHYFVNNPSGVEISNTTLSSCQNTSFTVSAEGSYTLHLYAYDSFNNFNQSNSSFTVTLPLESAGGGGVAVEKVKKYFGRNVTEVSGLQLPGEKETRFSLFFIVFIIIGSVIFINKYAKKKKPVEIRLIKKESLINKQDDIREREV